MVYIYYQIPDQSQQKLAKGQDLVVPAPGDRVVVEGSPRNVLHREFNYHEDAEQTDTQVLLLLA
jgi:hypothetical protein